MAFETFDLGRVIGAAEQIKGLRRQATRDNLEDNYLRAQTGALQQRQQAEATEQKATVDARTARQHYLTNQAIASAADPIGAVKQFAPEMIEGFNAKHGQGAFEKLTPDQVKQIATYAQQQAAAAAGIDMTGGPEFQARQQAAQAQDAKDFEQAQELEKQKHGYRIQENSVTAANAPHTRSIVTRPTGDGKVQDFLVDTRTGERTPNGEPYVSAQNAKLRQIPVNVAQGIIENRAQLNKINSALADVEKNPAAFGTQNYAPDFITQRMDGPGYSGGVPTRAKVADIGSLIIHDRSGAAVSASEMPRLAPFIPAATDSPEVVKNKLTNLRANVESMLEETEAFYSTEAGYQAIPNATQGGKKPEADPLEGRTATGPNGQKLIRRGGQWQPI